MDKTLYESIRDNLFALDNKKAKLTKQIDCLMAQREEISQQISDLDFILNQYGRHVYRNYIEESEEVNENNN